MLGYTHTQTIFALIVFLGNTSYRFDFRIAKIVHDIAFSNINGFKFCSLSGNSRQRPKFHNSDKNAIVYRRCKHIVNSFKNYKMYLFDREFTTKNRYPSVKMHTFHTLNILPGLKT
jgi:hypothetical protein